MIDDFNYGGFEMALEKIISKNLKRLRQSRGLSQKRLAELAAIDVRQISKYENSPDHFSSRTIERLAQGLGVSPHELLVNKSNIKDELPKGMEEGMLEAVRILRVHLGRIREK